MVQCCWHQVFNIILIVPTFILQDIHALPTLLDIVGIYSVDKPRGMLSTPADLSVLVGTQSVSKNHRTFLSISYIASYPMFLLGGAWSKLHYSMNSMSV